MIKNKENKAIFCDCFNTLICRTKHPDDVLFDWAKMMHAEYNQLTDINFFEMFKNCWKKLEHIDIIEIENSEFLMDIKEIFNVLADTIIEYKMINDLDKIKFCEIAFRNYYIAEEKSHYLKKSTYNYLIKQKKQGKKIYLVSDFYCTKDIILQWLNNLNIKDDFFDNIFVSCEYRKSKKTGSLYKEITQILNIEPQNIKMIGDNVISDNIMALKQKLKTKSTGIYIGHRSKELREIKQKLFIPFEYKEIFDENKEQNIYVNYAFPLYLFTKKLFDYCKRKDIHDIYFLAREGKFLKILFEEYQKQFDFNIKSHYLIVSRSSLINAIKKPYEEKFAILSNKFFISTHNFLQTLNFPKEKITSICKNLKIKENAYHFCLAKSKTYNKLLNSQEFNDYYKSYNESQYNAFLEYSKNCGINKNDKDLLIVDSGWHGSIQKYLDWFFEDKKEISGCYVGTDLKHAQNKKLYGLLFSKKYNMGLSNKIFSYRMYNYEEVLRAEDGTCKSYDPSTCLPILDNNQKEKEYYINYIKDFQDLVLQKFIKIMQVDKNIYSNIESVCAYMYYQTIKQTKSKDRDWYDKVQSTYVDSFGYFGYTYKNFGSFLRKFNFRIKDLFFVLKYKNKLNKKRLFWE